MAKSCAQTLSSESVTDTQTYTNKQKTQRSPTPTKLDMMTEDLEHVLAFPKQLGV